MSADKLYHSKGGTLKPYRAILGAFFVAILIKVFVFDFKIAEGSSMSPTIEPGTLLFVLKVRYGLRLPLAEDYLFLWLLPKEGDIVVFYTPNGEIAVKRCAEVFVEDRVFMALGDNPAKSFDSRSYGPVPITKIIGKVLGY